MNQQALRIVGMPDNEAERTFILRDEDHTLGNALRHVIMMNEHTDFCGYSVPHPSEPLVNIRVQTTGVPAVRVMDQGLQQLMQICDTMAAQLTTHSLNWPSETYNS